MGCFLGCFGGPKDRKHRRSPEASQLGDPIKQPSLKQISLPLSPALFPPEAALVPIPEPELRVINEQGNLGSSRRRVVTFDLNITTYEPVAIHEEENHLSEDDEELEAIEKVEKPKSEEVNFTLESTTYPSNHRYQNCESDDDANGEHSEDGGDEEEDYEDYDIDEVDDGDGLGIVENEESYESYFSRPSDDELQITREVNSPAPKSMCSPDKQSTLLLKRKPRDRSQYVHPVLNPVENLSQWKQVKVHTIPVRSMDKENRDLVLESKIRISPNPSRKQEVSVDSSLSSWLVSSGKSTVERTVRNSAQTHPSFSREERAILGSSTVEYTKRTPATLSSRSPSRSPDEIAIVGAGSGYSFCRYNSDAKGIPNTTSKYREDKVVNWHSTPFDVKLERALNKTSA
ncbi:uncharacterized protein LOC109707137 [Ananas comosus]|uniref:Uncharacterized protein LOC109707137 n=1 Tax=Ananas comosus TaxID=4615 RepID=A0A6P5ER99_ANACO|nr:uncharacterized protein LOC109707137 [Ananas comosus]